MIGFNLKIALIIILGIFVSGSVSAEQALAKKTANVHALSLKVFVGGKEIMTPNLDVVPGRTAYVTLNSKTEGAYTLQLDVVDDAPESSPDSAGVQAVLWKGGVNKGAKLLDAILLLDHTPPIDVADSKSNASVAVRSKSGAENLAEIQIVSHAVMTEDVSKLSPARACLNSEGVVPIQPMGKGCCTKECKNQKDEMTCCGAERCCACDVCCSPK